MKTNFRKGKIAIYSVVGILIVILLTVLGIKSNIEHNFVRNENEDSTVPYTVTGQVEREDAPLGIAVEYELDLSSLDNDTELVFHSSHSFVEVYIEDELVYSMKTSPEIKTVTTTSGHWNVVNLHREDAGKKCTVVFMPAYKGFVNQSPEFMLGSIHSAFISQFEENLPEIIVTLLVMITGFVFIVFGLMFSTKAKGMLDFISLGAFAFIISLWRLTDLSFISFLFENKNIFIYYISLTMLMVSMIPLLEYVKHRFSERFAKAFNILSGLIGVTSIIQLLLQIFGVYELREMLTVTHISIIAALLLILICIVIELIKPPKGKRSFNTAVIIIAGIAADLIIFYVRDSSAGLIFTLLSISVFVLTEGFGFIARYVEQQNELAEHKITIAQNEARLSQSRFTMSMSQIRSHFVFNILNAISGMCKYDPEKADKTIVHFARFLRSNIDIMQNDELVHFHNALRHLEDYVALEQVRYGDSIEFVTDIQVDDFMLPPLVMQPIVENSIKHGITPKNEGGTVTLRTREDNNNVYIIIEDDGVGYDSGALISEKSVGIQNTVFRLKHMVNGTLKMESIVGIGTKATITIPRKEAEKCM